MPLLDLRRQPAVPGFSLAQYTRGDLVLPELRERDTAGIISELSLVLQRQGCVPDMLPFCHTALNQELLASSALDCGLAFPHARSSGVKELRFAFGRTPEPVNWGARNSWRVQLVFLLAVPATDATTYLQVLAGLARLGHHSQLVSRLRNAADTKAILATLDELRLRIA